MVELLLSLVYAILEFIIWLLSIPSLPVHRGPMSPRTSRIGTHGQAR